MKINKSSSAFTLIELLVVIAIIAILAAFAVPALTSALKKGQMTGTMNNARQLYIAQFQMSNDGAASSDTTLGWPGDLIAGGYVTAGSLEEYVNYLLAKGYLRGGDANKLLTAPGCNFTSTYAPGPPETLTFGGTGPVALKVYPVIDADPVSGIFCVSHNYIYDTDINTNAGNDLIPYGTNGFIVVHKGGDASIFRVGQAVDTNWPDIVSFQTQVGFKTGDTYGTAATAGDPTGILKFN